MRRSRLVFLASLVPTLAVAQSTDLDARLKDMLKQTTIQLREAQDENATIKAKQAEDDGKIQDLTQQLATAKQQLADATGKSKASEEAQAALAAAEDRAKNAEDQLQQLQTSLSKWQDAYKQAADVARARDSDAKTLAVEKEGLDRRIDDCIGKNVELYKIGTDILDQYQNVDMGDVLARKEPFTQIARVKLENAVQDYQDKLRDQKAKAQPASAPPSAPAAPANETR